VATTIHQQTAIKHKLPDINPPSYFRHQPELVLGSANRILPRDKSILTDKTVDFDRADIVIIDRENKMALVIDIAVPLTYNLPKTEAEKIKKYDQLALGIKTTWKLNNVSIQPLVVSAEGMITKSFLKYIENTGLTKSVLRVGQEAVLLQTCHTVGKFLGHLI
jgi:hypothetical protein